MTLPAKGRRYPTPPLPYPGHAEDFTQWAYPWNKPRKIINHTPDDIPQLITPLAAVIAAYNRDQNAPLTDEQKKAYEKRKRQIDYFEEHELALSIHLERLAESRKSERHNPVLAVQANLNSQPKFIRKPLQQRIDYLRKESGDDRVNEFLSKIVESALTRLDAVRTKQLTISYRHIAGRERLDDLLRLPELIKKEVKTLSAMVAAHMDMLFSSLADELLSDNTSPDTILHIYHAVAAEASRLCIQPPYWLALGSNVNRRGDVPYHLLPGALARLRCADWWHRKLWNLRCVWREEQLRAVCMVHKLASAYVSYDALLHKREQYRRNLEFIRSHELVNDEGVSLDMEEVVNASNSNPRLRYIEMMTTAKGLENLADMRGDYGMFYTITCPSKYHATLKSGKPNPKWNISTVRESSDYLVNLFAGIRKKLHRQGLRWYGVRVAEPHHDGTVHWHLMCLMEKKDRAAITSVMREFAIREDRAELGKNVRPRFDAKPILKSKGTVTSYLAKYIGKNIGGQPTKGFLDKQTGEPLISKETGKPLSENFDNASAWASLHRVRQFQFFGIPSRQAYRELRLLAGQLQRKLKPKKGEKKGVQLLPDKRMDDVLAAADAGCIATYIIKQGGVLVPRAAHTIRTAYAESDDPNAYGEHGVQIYGIWSPRLGPESRICTHFENWKMVRKSDEDNNQTKASTAGAGGAVDLQGGSAVPWTRGNNCPHGQEIDDKKRKKRTTPPPDLSNFDNISTAQRRELLNRVRESSKNTSKKVSPGQNIPPEIAEMCRDIARYAEMTGWELEPWQLKVLAAGGKITFPNKMSIQLDAEWREVGEVRLVKFFNSQTI